MSSALVVNGSRVLSPAEASAIRAVISKPSNRIVFDLMLYTGIRFSELRQITGESFDPDRRVIVIRSGKPMARQVTRNVRLCDRGLATVATFIDAPKLQKIGTWRSNLIGWARAARLTPLPGSTAAGNPTGITVRTTRKTLESWLLTAYPDRPVQIALSQGHTESTALRHYWNLSFTEGEREAIRGEVVGW